MNLRKKRRKLPFKQFSSLYYSLFFWKTLSKPQSRSKMGGSINSTSNFDDILLQSLMGGLQIRHASLHTPLSRPSFLTPKSFDDLSSPTISSTSSILILTVETNSLPPPRHSCLRKNLSSKRRSSA